MKYMLIKNNPLSRDCIQILKEKGKALSTVCQLHLKIVETCIDSERPPSFNVFSFEKLFHSSLLTFFLMIIFSSAFWYWKGNTNLQLKFPSPVNER